MIVRRGTSGEMRSTWYKKHTSEFFQDNMESGNAEFWTMEDNGRLVGELYIFFQLTDQDFADGETTAYLCAFRIAEELRRKRPGNDAYEPCARAAAGDGVPLCHDRR